MITDNRRRDYYAGAVLIVLGLSAAYIASKYQIGTLTRMGPGFFPTVLGVLLAFIGVLVALFASGQSTVEAAGVVDLNHGADRPADWRGWGCIIASVLAFIVLAEYAGLLAATFFCVFIAALGDRQAKLKNSAYLATGITVFGIVLFSYVLRVQIPIVRGF